MTSQKGFTIKEAADSLGIKYGTAKTIMRIFKMKGSVDRVVKSDKLFKYHLNTEGKVIKEVNEDYVGFGEQSINLLDDRYLTTT